MDFGERSVEPARIRNSVLATDKNQIDTDMKQNPPICVNLIFICGNKLFMQA